MNFLAHFSLSGDNENLIIGNFLGDFVKGKQYRRYPTAIAQGILLHRAIDSFTDQHPVLQASKARLRPVFGRYAPILLDVLLDYLLASSWQQFYTIPLSDFSVKIYGILSAHTAIFPPTAQVVARHIAKENWLVRYETVAGTQKSLRGLARRLGVALPFADAIDVVLAEREAFFEEFLLFWKEINQFVVHFYKDC